MKLVKKTLCIIISVILINLLFSLQINAIDLTKTKGSLTIIKYEKGAVGYEGENIPLNGVEFAIYKVSDDERETTTPSPETQPTAKKATGEDGKVKFSELDIGRYLVVETKVPENVTERIENFLVDIPQTIEDGTDLIYDVTVQPKNNTAYGKITLIKQGKDSEKLKGVKFVLQKKNGQEWNDYPDTTRAILATNENGEIIVENLPIGDYRFVETSLEGYEKYILDNKTGYEFKVALDTTDFKTIVTPDKITVVNDKPEIEKGIDHITRDTKDTNTIKDEKNSADIGDTITYKIQTDIPKAIARLVTYKVTDTMENGLTLKLDNFDVKAGNQKLIKETDYEVTPLNKSHGFILELKDSGKTKLDVANKAGAKKMEVIYDVLLNREADATNKGNKNKAKLTYSNVVTTNYKEESNNSEAPNKTITTNEVETIIYTGGLLIEKRANSKTGELLSSAVFKIAATKTDANNKKFIKDSDGKEITLTTEEAGTVSYKGLSYGKYYLVEVQAPSYDENGTKKYYNLLNKPIEITVSNNTYTQNANIVINRKQTVLPFTGAIGSIGLVLAGCALISLAIIISRKK